MNVRVIYRLTGYLSIVVGILAACCIYRIRLMPYALALSILGFILAVINIFLNTKYFYEQEKFAKGYLGMFLSSLPVLFMMLIAFKFRN